MTGLGFELDPSQENLASGNPPHELSIFSLPRANTRDQAMGIGFSDGKVKVEKTAVG